MKVSSKLLSSLLLVFSSIVTPIVLIKQPTEAQEAKETNGRFINNFLSGKCIDVAGAPGHSNGASLQLWDCELSGRNLDNGSDTDQIWVLINGGYIRNMLSGKCIDVAGAPGHSNGASLQLWDCELSGRNLDNGSDTDQQWTITSDGFIRNTLSGKCIDVAGAPGHSNGARLQLWDCELSGRNLDNSSDTDQQWSFANYSSFHLDKPQIPVGAVRELPLRYGLPIRKWL